MRDVRLRQDGIQRRVIDSRWRAPIQTARQSVKVYDGGSIPTTVPSVFLTHPTWLDADDTEAASYTSADESSTIPVVVIGPGVPIAGDILTAHSIGGRWVAEKDGTSVPTLSCLPCGIPKMNLKVCYKNYLIGDGTATMTYTPPGQWGSACTLQLLYQMACASGSILFTIVYFLSGGCPGGQRQTCSSSTGSPFGLTLSSYTCDPFLLHYTCTNTGCPALWSNGYTDFYITTGSCP